MKKYIPYIIIAVLAVLLFFSVERCTYNARKGNDNAAAVLDTVTYFTNKLGTKTASIATLQLDKKQLQSLVLDKDKELAALASEFSKVRTVVKAEGRMQIDSIPVPYAVPIPCDFERSGEVLDKWYSFGYNSTQNGFKIENLQVPNTITVITGTKRKWFLGKETVTTDITNSNPHIKVIDLKAAEVVVPVPFYKKWYVWLATGALGGYLLTR